MNKIICSRAKFTLLISLLVIPACQKKSNSISTLDRDTTKKTDLGSLALPKDFLAFNDISNFPLPNHESFLIIKYLNSECTKCKIEIAQWKEMFSSDNSINDTRVIFIVHGQSKIDVDFLFHSNNFAPKYYYDYEWSFFDANEISANPSEQVLAISNDYSILFKGSLEEAKAFVNEQNK